MTNSPENIILLELSFKPMAYWTPLTEIEADCSPELDHMQVRGLLPVLLKRGLVEYSRHESSYKITAAGRRELNRYNI